jgi:hypothetical protein
MGASFLLAAAALAAAACTLPSASATQVTISNVVPRRATDGAIMDAHDGKVLRSADGTYYWYAASYGNCTEPTGNTGCKGAAPGACGFQLNHNVSVFSSRDLVTWTDEGHALEMASSGLSGDILFCPKVLYNAATQTFVMYFNWIAGASE